MMENPKIHYSSKDSSKMETMEILMVCMNDWVVACTGTRWYGGAFKSVQPFLRDELVMVFECNCNVKKHKLEIRDEKNQIVKPHEFKCEKLMLCPGFFGRRWSLWVDGDVWIELTLDKWKAFRHPRPEFPN